MIYPTNSGFTTGFINFEDMCAGTCGASSCDGTCVSGNFWGLYDLASEGLNFGLHINEFGALNSGLGCGVETGTIFNPDSSAYGLPSETDPYPMGALGNVSTSVFTPVPSAQCNAQPFAYCAPIGSIDLSQGANGILGRSVVIRSLEDDGTNASTGASNPMSDI